jgi:hypothetical protein
LSNRFCSCAYLELRHCLAAGLPETTPSSSSANPTSEPKRIQALCNSNWKHMFRHSFRRIAKLTVVSASPNTYSVPPHTHTQSRSLRLAHLLCYSPLLTSSGTDYNQQMHENRPASAVWLACTSRKRAIDYPQISEETTKVTDHTFVFPLALVENESGTHVAASI